MADRVLYTNAAALREANQVALTLANPDADPDPTVAHVRLFDSTLIPGPTTTKAELEGAEITLVGYPAGGYEIEEFAPAIFAPGGGAVIQSPIINVGYASGAAVTVGGYWLEDPADAVRQVFVYDPPRTLAQVGDGFPIVVQAGYGRNAS